MIAKLWRVMAIVIAFGLIFPFAFVGPVQAGDPYAGDGPDNALTAGDDYQPVEPGKPLWFAFCWQRTTKDPQVQMWSKPGNGAEFLVLTPGNAQHWRTTGKIESIGACSADPNVKGQRFWKGDFKDTGTYFVIVKHSKYPGAIPDSPRPPTYFKLLISGGGVVDCK